MDAENQQVQEVSVLRFASTVATKIYRNTSALKGKAIYFSGQMPYTYSDLSSLLPEEIIHADVDENPPDDYDDPTVAFFVIGKEGFDEDEITRLVQ